MAGAQQQGFGGGAGRGGPQQQAPQETVTDKINAGLTQLETVDPVVANNLRVDLAGMSLDDTAANRSNVENFMNAAFAAAKTAADINIAVENVERTVYPTQKVLTDLGSGIERLLQLSRDAGTKMSDAISSLLAADSSLDVGGLEDAARQLTDNVATAHTNSGTILAAIQAAYVNRMSGPANDPAYAPIFEETLSTAAPVVVGSVRTSTGRDCTLELFKEDGFAFAKIKISNGAGSPDTEVVYKLDQGKTWRDATSRTPDAQLEALENTRARIAGRMDVLLREWESLRVGPPTDVDTLAGNTGYGVVAESQLGQSLYAAGAKISQLSDGAFVDQNIAGLDLSDVVFKNFDITSCWAQNVRLARASFTGECHVDNNDMQNADCSRIKFETRQGSTFTKNDLHGNRGSVAGADFADISCRDNNLMGVDMNGIKSETLNNILAAEKGGMPFVGAAARARAAFKDQFKGSSFLLTQLGNDPVNRKVFETNSSAVTSGKQVEALLADLPYNHLMDIVSSNPLLSLTTTTGVPADPNRGILRSGIRVNVTARDGSVSNEAHFEDGMRQGYLGQGDTPKMMGSLDILSDLLTMATTNRYGWGGAANRKGADPSAVGARMI